MTRLEQLRLDGRLTVDELAEASGVSARTIYRLERGEPGVWDTTLWKLADYFKVAPSELLRRVDLSAA